MQERTQFTAKMVYLVERTLKNADLLMTRKQLVKKLAKKIPRHKLNGILKYLEDRGKIIEGSKGILWIHNPSSKLRKAIREGAEH